MGGLFKQPKVEPAKIPAAPTRSEADVQDQAAADRRRAYATGSGVSSTFLTGGTGVQQSKIASVTSRFLGGASPT